MTEPFIRSIRKLCIAAALCAVIRMPASAQIEHDGDWVSTNTLASVVKLSSLLSIYEVEGLPDSYSYHTKGGEPDFGEASIVSHTMELTHVGSGVLVTNNGLIISNAHVTRAYSEPLIQPLKGGRRGPKGKSIKQVVVNHLPNFMFVGVTEKERLEKGDDAQRLGYLAAVLEDDRDYDYTRDRAVLKIVAKAYQDVADGLPVIDEKVSGLNIPCAVMGNPFKTSFIDKKVRAIGFPGTGDPNRSARTVGELLGYENEHYSRILHTSYISNGNSGGGLFYKDKLIGINTWDSVKNSSRPVALAQPLTYWYDILIKAQWVYSGLSLPDGLFIDWLEDDPGTERYKNEVQALFTFVSESNKNEPVTRGRIFAHRIDTDIQDVLTYLTVEQQLSEAAMICECLKYLSVDEIAQEFDFSKSYVENFVTVSDIKQLRGLMKAELRPYFDEWYDGTFYCKQVVLDDPDGKTTVSVPKDSKVRITFLADDDETYTTLTLTTGTEYMQGPFTISVQQ